MCYTFLMNYPDGWNDVILRWSSSWDSDDITWTPFESFNAAILWAKNAGVFIVDIIEDFPAE